MSATKPQSMTYERLKDIVSGPAAAIRLRTKLQPAGGPGDKVFPPTYSGGIYACEDRRLDDRVVHTVVLDSVQSQANRFEIALLDAYQAGQLRFPLIKVDFSDPFPDLGEITSLEVPHRSADAIIRDSLLLETPFPDTDLAKRMMNATVRSATALFEYCPTALIFGTWDSTGARGGMGNKFARCIVSEVVAFETEVGVRTSSRIDPLGIGKVSLYESATGEWTALEFEAKRDAKGNPVAYKRKSKDKGKPSEINHGNVTPDLVRGDKSSVTSLPGGVTVTDTYQGVEVRFLVRGEKSTDTLPGGVTMAYALQTIVLSLPGLRRLGFPDASGKKTIQRDAAAHLALAALTLAAIAYQRQRGYDFRSRCLLVPEEEPTYEVVTTAKDIEHLTLSTKEAATIFARAVEDAKKAGLPWHDQPVELQPKQALIELIKKSREAASTEETSDVRS